MIATISSVDNRKRSLLDNVPKRRRRHAQAVHHNVSNRSNNSRRANASYYELQEAIDDSQGARLTYSELSHLPAQPSPREDFQPTVYAAETNCSECKVVTSLSDGPARTSASTAASLSQRQAPRRAAQLPPIFLMRRDNPQQAYAKLANKVETDLDHHWPGWGKIVYGVIYKRVEGTNNSSGNNSSNVNAPLTFWAPPPSEAQYVAIKVLYKEAVRAALAQGREENPWKEIARMEEIGDNVHVLRHLEALEDEDHLYIVMPRACDDGTLKDVIPWFSKETMDMDRAKSIFRQILKILVYLEQKGICHRDLSPDNFLFLDNNHLVAFDLALSVRIPKDPVSGQRCLMAPSGNFGTRRWMAPEVWRNRVYDGPGSDLWSALLVLYNMLTNQILYHWPHPADLSFRYFVLAGGLSREPMNERAVEVLREAFPLGQNVRAAHAAIQEQGEFINRAIAHMKLDTSAMELFEHMLTLDIGDRWTLAEVANADFVKEDEEEVDDDDDDDDTSSSDSDSSSY